MLREQGTQDFGDRIGDYLDADLMRSLHHYPGRDRSGEITISTRDAIAWGKAHMRPVAEPGTKHHYTDTS